MGLATDLWTFYGSDSSNPTQEIARWTYVPLSKPLLQDLPNDSLRQLIDFARFLAWQEEQKSRQEFGQSQLAQAYGPDEPDYSLSEIKPRSEA